MDDMSAATDTRRQKPLCFVIGPIGKEGSQERKHADLLLNAVIKEVLQRDEFGYQVKRADEDADPGMIGDRVVSDIIQAELVVADLTDLNPNAFYELGIRHSTEKPTIHVAKAGTQLPFDNIAHRTIFVDLTDWSSQQQARSRLADSVHAIKAPDYKVSNPITQANASFRMRQSEDPRDQLIAAMQDRLASIESAVANNTGQTRRSQYDQFIDEIAAAIKTERAIEAIKSYRAATNASLKDAKEFVDALRQNRKIDAIKVHRTVTGADLSQSRGLVEDIAERVGD
jgi:ribosomal protein L7/L12